MSAIRVEHHKGNYRNCYRGSAILLVSVSGYCGLGVIVRIEYVWGGDCLIVKLSLWRARCEYVRKVWEKKILNVLHVIDLCPIAR